MNEYHNQRSELSGELKQICAKYEGDLKTFGRELEEEKERATDLEGQLRERERVLEERQNHWGETESSLKNMLGQATDQVKLMEQAVSLLKKENEKLASMQAKESTGKSEQHQQQVVDLETSVREAMDLLKQKDHEMRKDTAIKDQKI